MIRKHDVARKTACTHYITYRITVVRGGPRQKNKSCNVCRKFGQVKPVVLTEVGYASEHARGQTDTFISLLCTPPGEISKDEHQRPLIFFSFGWPEHCTDVRSTPSWAVVPVCFVGKLVMSRCRGFTRSCGVSLWVAVERRAGGAGGVGGA